MNKALPESRYYLYHFYQQRIVLPPVVFRIPVSSDKVRSHQSIEESPVWLNGYAVRTTVRGKIHGWMVADIHPGTLDHNFRFLPGSSVKKDQTDLTIRVQRALVFPKYGRTRGYDRSGKHRSILPFSENASSTSGIRLFPWHPSCMWGIPSFARWSRNHRAEHPLVRLDWSNEVLSRLPRCCGWYQSEYPPLIQHRVGGHIRLQTTTADADDTGYNNTTRCEDNLPFPVGTFFLYLPLGKQSVAAICGNWAFCRHRADN